MKTLTTLLAGLLFVSLMMPAVAQQQEETSQNSSRLQQKFTVSFGGGTAEEFMEEVRMAYLASHGESTEQKRQSEIDNWNIVLTEASKRFQLPQVNVTTNLNGILNLLDALADDYSVGIDHLGDEEEILLIDISTVEDEEVAVVNVKQLLEAIPEKTFLSAITSGLEMSGASTRVELKLHQETGLLFVKGVGDEIMLVDQVVDQLNRGQGLGTSEMGMGGGGGMMGGMMGMGGGGDMMGGGMGMGGARGGMGADEEEGGYGMGAGLGGLGGMMGGGRGMGGTNRGSGQSKQKQPKK